MMEFERLFELLSSEGWFPFFEILEGKGGPRIRPKTWVIHCYMTLPFYLAANLSGDDLVEIFYEKIQRKHPTLEYDEVEKCVGMLFTGEDLFTEILHWFLEGGDSEFQKIVYLDSLKRFYIYGRRLGSVIQYKDDIEKFILEQIESVGSA
jgi:hypothetical protein